MRLHHVQVSIPRGGEEAARRFYGDGVGLAEVDKPPALAGRGGCWFRHVEDGLVLVEIHCGVEEPFRPAQKAHPALVVDTAEGLSRMAARIEHVGGEVTWAERTTFEGFLRFHARDPSGNRLEVLTPA